MQKLDLIGNTYGHLVVIERAEANILPCGQKQTQYLCKCDCGNTKIVRSLALRSGSTKSCGCRQYDGLVQFSIKHGKRHDKIYNTYRGMKDRCYNKNNSAYKNYGAKGVTVCDEWLRDFSAFFEWSMNNGYIEGLTIDRIDSNGNYEPSNCRWITRSDNSRNRNNEFWRKYHEGKVSFRGKTANAGA